MTAAEPSVYASLPMAIIAFAQTLGVEREALVAASGLSEAELSDPDELVSYESLVGVWTLLCARYPDEPLGLRYAEVVPLGIFGALGYAMEHSATGREALQAYFRFCRLVDPFIEVQLIETEGRMKVSIDHEPRVRAMTEIVEMLVGAMIRYAVQLVFGAGSDWPPNVDVGFRHAQRHSDETYARFFPGAELTFEADYDGCVFDATLLDMPIPKADPALGRHLIASLEATLQSRPLGAAPSLTDRVRQAIEAALTAGTPSQADVAKQLAMATRTLQRRLADEGVTFSELLDEVRKGRAELLLRQPGLSVQEVAYLLGYSEPRAFHRSFRRWTGASAGAWRRQAAGAK